MNKNQKIILASVGVLFALIVGILLIRTPGETELVPEPTKQVEKEILPEIRPPKEMDQSHEKVVAIVDEVAGAIGDEAPNLWARIVSYWHWFEVFPARYAVILLLFGAFVVGTVANGKSKRSQQGR